MKLELESIRRLQTPAIQTIQFFNDTKRYVFITGCNLSKYKNHNSLIVIGLNKLFSTNLLAKLLSDSLLSDSSISQSHSKF